MKSDEMGIVGLLGLLLVGVVIVGMLYLRPEARGRPRPADTWTQVETKPSTNELILKELKMIREHLEPKGEDF